VRGGLRGRFRPRPADLSGAGPDPPRSGPGRVEPNLEYGSALRDLPRVPPRSVPLAVVSSSPLLSLQRSALEIVIRFEDGLLDSVPAITGPWAPVTAAASPPRVRPERLRTFYRTRCWNGRRASHPSTGAACRSAGLPPEGSPIAGEAKSSLMCPHCGARESVRVAEVLRPPGGAVPVIDTS